MTREELNNSMRLESYDLQKLAKELYDLNAEKINNALKTIDYLIPQQVIAVGCGDSFCAAKAAQEAFKELVGIPMIGRPAVEISRCYDSEDFNNVLMFGISSRGKTARVIEAAMRVHELGTASRTVAIVNFLVEKSKLEEVCDTSIHVSLPEFKCGKYTEHAPCQRSYFSTMFTMMLIAVRMGEIRGNYSAEKAEEYRQAMLDYAAGFTDEVLNSIEDQLWKLLPQWNQFRQFEIVGSGEDAPNTWFVAAKVVEAFGDIATYDTPDNWLAVNSKTKEAEQTGTIVILNKDNKAFVHTVDVIRVMAEKKRPTIVITDAETDLFPEGVTVVRIPSAKYKWVKPLMQYCPVGLLFGYIKELRDVSFYRYGGECDDERGALRERLDGAIFDLPLRVIK